MFMFFPHVLPHDLLSPIVVTPAQPLYGKGGLSIWTVSKGFLLFLLELSDLVLTPRGV